jgi:hypothetical protein
MKINVSSYDYPIITKLVGKTGLVHSVFRHSLVLQIEKTMITLVPVSRGKGPGFVMISGDYDFRELPLTPGNLVSIFQDRISIGTAISIELSQEAKFDSTFCFPSNILFEITQFERNYEYICSYIKLINNEYRSYLFKAYFQDDENSKEVIYIRRNLCKFRDSIIYMDEINFEESLSAIIGLGQGLTPSFDDMIIGILVSLRYMNHYKESLFTDQTYPENLNFALNKLPPLIHKFSAKTNFISSSFLVYALENRFTGNIKDLLDSIFIGDIKKSCILEKFLEYSSYSSLDTLLGILFILQIISR